MRPKQQGARKLAAMGDLVPENGFEGQNTVNMLDQLPDMDFFSFPVNDFFDSYVSELGARGVSAAYWPDS